MIISDANSAVSSVAYRTNEVIAIYPITPSSTMAEKVSHWPTLNKINIFGDVPKTIEMQSEAGAIATVHGALHTGALSTTFTSSQGLLLMIPTLYKLAGQLMPFVLYAATRTVATHALSIFSDHSDVMAVRQTGCAMLSTSSVQEAQNFSLIAQIASLKSSLPFIHFFDGFRNSHEINTIERLETKTIKRLMPYRAIETFRSRALTPDNPVIRGTAANLDTYFQCREAKNIYYDNAYQHVVEAMNNFASETGRQYTPYKYYGADNATHIIILMGSAAGTVKEVIEVLLARAKKGGVLIVHLFRPFSAPHLLNAIPESVSSNCHT